MTQTKSASKADGFSSFFFLHFALGRNQMKAGRFASLTILINMNFYPIFLFPIKRLNSAQGPCCISPSQYVLNI